jgi:hypothetical protein
VCHHLRMRHNLPPTPAFHNSHPTDPIQEIALRVIVELPGWQYYVVGTATLIGGHLAVTAKHVLQEAMKFGAKKVADGFEVSGHSLRLFQPGSIESTAVNWVANSSWSQLGRRDS